MVEDSLVYIACSMLAIDAKHGCVLILGGRAVADVHLRSAVQPAICP